MRQVSTFRWFLILASCTLVVFAAGAISLYIEVNRLPVEPEHLIESAEFWVFWALHAPLIIIAARRFSFERRRLAGSLLIYLSAGTAWAMLVQGLPLFLFFILKDLTSYNLDRFHLFSDWAMMLLPNLLLYWLILSLGLIFSYYQRYQNELLKATKLDAQLSNARFQALQMQLHPHFLFNTLHSVSALVLKNENRDAVKMINRLSELLRLSLDNIETQVLSLEDELEFTRRYLEIERIRFHDRLTIEWQIDPQARTAEVPNLILQPLVENAMRHGVDSNSQASRLQIAARVENERVVMQVRDDGKNPEKVAAQNGAAGLGLKNTRARLAELYGEDHSFSLTRSADDWTTAQIVIPFSAARQPSQGETA